MPPLIAPGTKPTFHTQHPMLSQLRMDALTHDYCLSLHKLQTLQDPREAYFIVTNSHWLLRTQGVVTSALLFALERLGLPRDNVQRFHPRMMAKSYYHAAYPLQFTEQEVHVSLEFISAYEALLRQALEVDAIADFSPQVCEAYVRAVDAHVAFFGENREITLEELKETALSDFAYMYAKDGGKEEIGLMETWLRGLCSAEEVEYVKNLAGIKKD